MKNLQVLPDNLPVPQDDGACAHLEGMQMPSLSLESTFGREVDLSAEDGIVVVYFYPMTGRPDAPPMIGWNEIPGARGCTPQSCAFRDHHAELRGLGVQVYGVSSQSPEDQKEAVQRLHLPFELLSDNLFELAGALRLPTFEYNSLTSYQEAHAHHRKWGDMQGVLSGFPAERECGRYHSLASGEQPA